MFNKKKKKEEKILVFKKEQQKGNSRKIKDYVSLLYICVFAVVITIITDAFVCEGE